jgi:hypothetical protein
MKEILRDYAKSFMRLVIMGVSDDMPKADYKKQSDILIQNYVFKLKECMRQGNAFRGKTHLSSF